MKKPLEANKFVLGPMLAISKHENEKPPDDYNPFK
jgi:hypothetical protein